jgi:hypothetical protein
MKKYNEEVTQKLSTIADLKKSYASQIDEINKIGGN